VKVAVVTGGASGIGRACAELLGAGGAHVVVADVDEDGALDTVAAIDSAEFCRLDVGCPAAIEREFAAIVERPWQPRHPHQQRGARLGPPRLS
jgi:NAD(P)-dependent dehydrogenase (short-subunit alcohol dehydrogenase family)